MLTPHPQGVVLTIRAQPGARRSGIVGLSGGMLKVAVTEAPEKGKANAAIIDVLAEALGLRRGQIELLSGETSRLKRVLIRGADAVMLEGRIAAVLDDAT